MTAAELIARLEKLDPDAEIFTGENGGGGGDIWAFVHEEHGTGLGGYVEIWDGHS